MKTLNNLICYIPYYDGSPKAYPQLGQTINSLSAMAPYLNLKCIYLFYCQPECADKVSKLGGLLKETDIRFEPKLLSVSKPVLLPAATYRFMQTDGRADDFCFYTEADHIVHIEPGFIRLIFEETEKENVVMPHRLGELWMNNKKKPCRWGEYYVGNYDSENIHSYSNVFDAMTGHCNAYAGAYFVRRSVTQKHELSFPLTTNLFWRGVVEYARRHSGRRLFASQAPYGLLLEAPSLIFEANGRRVLKPRHIRDLHVFHLSQGLGE